MGDETDDLDELLSPPPAADLTVLRDTLRRRTLRRLAITRWVRRAGRAAVAAAVFVAGIGVGAWRSPPAPRPTVGPGPREVVFVPVLVPLPPASAEPPAPEPARTARELELDAEQADGARGAALYRRAGDAYLSADEDYANAARCYRLFLARGGDPALAPESNDSWLLASLKSAAFKEKAHATADD